jgi:hypothetical protein
MKLRKVKFFLGDVKVNYGDVSISDEYIKSIPKDNVNDEVFYPSGASVGQEGFDE